MIHILDDYYMNRRQRNCRICNSSGHNRRNCPIIMQGRRGINRFALDRLPNFANDLIVQQEPQEVNSNDETEHNSIKQNLNIKFINELINSEEIDCPICYETIDKTSNNCCKLNCNHKFCFDCILTQLKQTNNQLNKNNQICCALCRQQVNTIYSIKSEELKFKVNK